MCFPEAPKAPPPLPVQAPPPLAIMAGSEDQSRNSSASLAASRGRSSLRIDRTNSAAGGVGSGLNIPS